MLTNNHLYLRISIYILFNALYIVNIFLVLAIYYIAQIYTELPTNFAANSNASSRVEILPSTRAN